MARNDNPALAAVEHRNRVKDEQVADYYARLDGLQPTPTQAENDRAKVGHQTVDDLDDKEDDGSEWQDEGTTRVLTAKLPGNNPYETRDLEAGLSDAAPRRGRGRPRAAASEE